MVVDTVTKQVYVNCWHGETIESILDVITKLDINKLILDFTSEFTVTGTFLSPTFQELNKYCNDNNIIVSLYSGAFTLPSPNVSPNLKAPFNYDVTYFPLSFLSRFYLVYTELIKKYKITPLNFNEFENYFYTLVNIPHYHRCVYMDHYHKYSLNKVGKFTWNNLSTDKESPHDSTQYQFRYWDEKVVKDEANNYICRDPKTIPPKDYFKSLIEVVLETTTIVPFITEKTIRPLVFGKPFIIAGHRHLHGYLRDLGFRLFENIIDYSFDEIEDEELRMIGIVKELKRLTDNFTIEELYNATKQAVEFNKMKVQELAISNASEYKKRILDIQDINDFLDLKYEEVEFSKLVDLLK